MSDRRVITFGTFDLFHLGHLKILERAKALGTYLIVGVSSDSLHFAKKGSLPVYNQDDRMKIVGAIKYVDEVFIEESLDLKGSYIKKYKADFLVMGNDWAGKFDELRSLCRVEYLPRTPELSSTKTKEFIRTHYK